MTEIDPEEIPTADAYAVAVIAAAKVLGEDPETFAGLGVRCRFPAFTALRTFYPEYPASRLGERLGMTNNPIPRFKGATKSRWWPTDGLAAEAAACAALEAI